MASKGGGWGAGCEEEEEEGNASSLPPSAGQQGLLLSGQAELPISHCPHLEKQQGTEMKGEGAPNSRPPASVDWGAVRGALLPRNLAA